MKLPARLETDVTLKGLWLAAIAAVFVALAALLAVQTVRLEGFKIWPLESEGWKPRAERLETELAGIKLAQHSAELAQKRLNNDAEKTYTTIATRIDDHAQAELPRQLDAAGRYIAAHRVRPEARGALGGAGATALGHGTVDGQEAGRPAELDDSRNPAGERGAGDDLVTVPAEDVRICTANTLQAEAAREWALELEAASRTAPD